MAKKANSVKLVDLEKSKSIKLPDKKHPYLVSGREHPTLVLILLRYIAI